jgi:hypothetical protein
MVPVRPARVDQLALGVLLAVSGTMIRLIRIAAGAPSTEAISEMRGRVGNERAKDDGVDHQHGAGDAGHAAGHHDEQLAARQPREIGPDEQRRLDHAEEDVGGGREPDRAADAKRALQQPGEAAHDRRQHAPIEQKRGQHAHHQRIGSACNASTNSAPEP